MSREAVSIATPAALLDFCTNAFMRVGVPEPDARLVADSLVQADLRGVETHGVVRLRSYVDRIRSGGMLARTETTILSDGGATLLLDGGNGLGQVVAARAMALAIDRARLHGIAWVGVRRSNHLGALAYFSRMGLEHDLISVAATGSSPRMAPWGGLTPLLSTGPWSIAIPAGAEPPIVVDFAHASINNNKAQQMAERGERLPPGFALDSLGNPTEDPAEALRGILLPIGGHKGYGLIVALTVLTSVLTGAAYGPSVPHWGEGKRARNLGHLMLALRVDRFGPIEEFKTRVDDLIRTLRASRPMPGVERIFTPGERSESLARRRQATGIPLTPRTVQSLSALASELSIPLPSELGPLKPCPRVADTFPGK